MADRRKYKNPPIDEALCEFRFAPGQEWDLTIPGRLHGAVKDEYAGKPRNLFQAQLQVAGNAPPAVAWNQNVSMVQLTDVAGTHLLTVGPDLLSVHILRPYPENGWEVFRPMIERAFEQYVAVAQPAGLMRLGIRYINRVEVPERTAKSDKYFKCLPAAVDGLPQNLQAFMHRAEYAYEDGVRLITTFATVDGPPDKSSFVLDLDVVLEAGESRPLGDALKLVDDLRQRERDAFEALITDELRRLFDA
ncbi:MAG: TIGR04255 family protein [Myxococcales bacterium]|nr:TIGR04255 family protein [Myxococcales bacterium]